jgi:membrane associated rhomboid family serine protease
MTNDNEDNGRTVPFRKIEPANDHDAPYEPAIRLPAMVKALSLITIAVFLVQQMLPAGMEEEMVMSLGFVPARYSGIMDFDWRAVVSPITYMFVHGGWMHLFMNVAMLAAFGAAIEKAIGGRKMLAIFMLGGLAALLFHFLFYPKMVYPMIGGSGAISALFGAAVMLMQQQGFMGNGRKPLMVFIGAWVLITLFFGFFGLPGEEGPVAWTAHIGGFFAGALLLKPVKAWQIN